MGGVVYLIEFPIEPSLKKSIDILFGIFIIGLNKNKISWCVNLVIGLG